MRHLIFMLSCLILIASPVQADDGEPADFPSLISAARVPGPLDFCGEAVDLSQPAVKERLEKELMLTLWDRPQVVLWLKRSTRYLALIEQILLQNALPADLQYIAIAESALRPHAGSSKGAIGFWQFLPATGRRYGLQIDNEKDERRNVFHSTQAAVDYFKDLYQIFGSWTLSAAAFNMGEQGLQSEILAQRTDNFYDLYLPLETQRYIFRVLAAKLILTDPDAYGFRFSDLDLYAPLEFDRLRLECFEETPILLVAEATGTTFKVIKDLNPELRGHYLAAGTHSILIPKGSAAGFNERYKKLVGQWKAEKQERIYVVQDGDNLTTISERFNVPMPALLIWNRLDPTKPIHPGDRLIIYPEEIPPPTD